MFYYISFLRPPPIQVSTDPILITPQICNDLRTEFLDDPIDIYYAWSLHDPPMGTTRITRPAKLTSWRASTAYKEIPVPRPPLPSNNSLWRLILSCGTTPDDMHVGLDAIGTTTQFKKTPPLAVVSMPVQFSRRPAASGGGTKGAIKGTAVKGTKQERIARSYALRVPTRDGPIVFDIIEQTSFDLDKKIWDSGIGLGAWLVHLFSTTASDSAAGLADLRDALFSTQPRHILELGAGTGIVAITLAIMRSTLDLADPGSIVTTDLPSALPILETNISTNHAHLHTCPPTPAILDWSDPHLAPPVQAQLEAGLDVIVMADVTYNTASFDALLETLARLVQHHPDGRPRVLMGYKERHPDERALWERARHMGLDFRQVAQVGGAGGPPVEIWLA